MENSPVKTEIVWVEEECHEIMLPLKQEDCKLEEKGLDGERESPTYTEVPPSPHGCHEIMLPLKQEDCKLEETPASVDYIQSSEEGGGEDIHKSEEMQFATVKCEKDSEDEIDEAADLDVKEDILIIEDENPLPSSSEEAGRLSSSAPEIQSEEIVPQTFYTRIGESYYCARCDTPFRRQSDFNSHVAKCHKQINRFQCPKCDRTFQFRSKLFEHIKIHSKAKPFTCIVCDQQFTGNSDLNKHMFIHTKGTANLKNFRVHIHRKHVRHIISDQVGETQLPSIQQKCEIAQKKNIHVCNQCGELYNSKRELTMHLSNAHDRRPKNIYKCPKCLKSFLHRSKLMDHMKFHSCNWKNDCNICNRTFTDRTRLFKHMQEHASADALITANVLEKQHDFPCRFCGKIFKRPYQLENHLVTHTKEDVFTCDICKKGFGRKQGLLNHMAQHTGIFPYSCPVCKIKFTSNANCIRHLETHSRDQPYSCAVCRVQFSSLVHLERHVLVHSDNQPSNSCAVCNKKFTQVSSLRYHMRLSLHGMLFACSLCGKPFFNSHVLKSHHRLMHRRTLSKSELHGNLQDGLSKEVTATFNGSLDKSLDMGEVESNIDRGSSDIHQTPSLATAQMRAIDNRAIQKRIETTIELDTDIDEVSYPNSRNEGETSSSGEGQNITEKGKEHFTSPQCSRPLASEKKLVQMHTNSNNCEGGNLPLNEKISVDGGTRKNASSLQSDSTQERPEFSCKECGIFLSNIQTYKKHNMAYHRDQAFKCNVCGSLYVQQSDLDSHMIVHTADRPYSCFICKKAFRQIRTLRLHLRCHEGKAKFPCEICDKIFDSIVALRQHLFSHTGKEVQP